MNKNDLESKFKITLIQRIDTGMCCLADRLTERLTVMLPTTDRNCVVRVVNILMQSMWDG